MVTSTDLTPRRATAVLDPVRGLAGCGDRSGATTALDLVDDLSHAGCFRMLVPRSHDGSGVDLLGAMRVYEELSRADASVGWTVMNVTSAWRNLGSLPGRLSTLCTPAVQTSS
jgi:indole-3-acetate monooxygenase